MSVDIRIIGADQYSDEYRGAVRLKAILEKDLPANALGEIILHPNATVWGHTINDIDIMMMGTLQNVAFPLTFYQDDEILKETVYIDSFCTTIEMKGHWIDRIFREGTELYVQYSNGRKAVTNQSNHQKNSTMDFFKQFWEKPPYVTNVIWFTGITSSELKSLLTINNKEILSNTLPNRFGAQQLFQKLAYQASIKKSGRRWHLNCISGGCSVDDLQRCFAKMAKVKEGMGELTRKRIEQLTAKDIKTALQGSQQDKFRIYRGKAGTGKTVALLQTAHYLAEEEGARVLLLTYNRALVYDLRRLLALADFPDMFSESCVHISTMQSFFFRLIRSALYKDLSGEEFINPDRYPDYLKEMCELLQEEDDSVQEVRQMVEDDSFLDWDYCMIDEAQDWTDYERDLILQLFPENRIIVADGGQQFVRRIKTGNWNQVRSRKFVRLKQCLRQKENLIQFVNHLVTERGNTEYRMLSSGNLPGGKVVVLSDEKRLFEVLKEENDSLKQAGNASYDMLCLVPSSQVEKDGENRRFKGTWDFEEHGIYLWDGTSPDNRIRYPGIDEVRVLQYDSSRGLEAWTVVCLAFDEFLKEKMDLFDPKENSNPLLLESEEDRREKYLMNWMLIPLTRAIDTIVIQLKEPESEFGQLVKRVAQKCKDYVMWM